MKIRCSTCGKIFDSEAEKRNHYCQEISSSSPVIDDSPMFTPSISYDDSSSTPSIDTGDTGGGGSFGGGGSSDDF